MVINHLLTGMILQVGWGHTQDIHGIKCKFRLLQDCVLWIVNTNDFILNKININLETKNIQLHSRKESCHQRLSIIELY